MQLYQLMTAMRETLKTEAPHLILEDFKELCDERAENEEDGIVKNRWVQVSQALDDVIDLANTMLGD